MYLLTTPPALAADEARRARMLHRWAREILERSDATVEDRQRARRNIDEALSLEPAKPAHWMMLGRLREIGREDRGARECFERAIRLAPADPEPRVRIARSWKRHWLRTLDRDALGRAIAQLDTVTALRPHGSEAWLLLVPMRYERGDLAGAADAASRAHAGRPRRAEAPLAVAYVAFRRGEVERADSLFRIAIPQLAPDLRVLFDEPARVLGAPRRPATEGEPAVAAAPAESPELDRLDPDPTTAANETKLEYWARVAHAYFLFHDPLRPGLDARAETYMRYGPPQRVELNPPGVPLFFDPNPLRTGRQETFSEYPLDALRMEYPELGMRVLLHDRSLNGEFTQPVSRDFIPGTVPDAGILARRGDLVSLGGGFAVFPTLPPPAQRLETRGVVSGFESDRGPRLLAQVRVAGAPDEALSARWVVFDAAGREVARGTQTPGISGCDPAAFRLAEFAADLPPGRYDIAFSVRDSRRRRGLYRRPITLAPPAGGVALSDIVLCCGDPSAFAAEGAVRIEADVDSRVKGNAPLVAYFEIYRLSPGVEGRSRFLYEYEVRRLPEADDAKSRRAAEKRPPVTTWVSREEIQPGPMRRQFLRIPTAGLSPGRYQVSVRVRDLNSGAEAAGSAEFVRD